MPIRAPRLSDLPPDEPPFESATLPRRRYLSAATQRLFARLYLEGLSGGDFEPALVSEYGATISAAWSPIWHRA